MDREEWLMIGIASFLALGMLICLILNCLGIEKQKDKCEKKGGFALETRSGYQCITKEDIRKIIGE